MAIRSRLRGVSAVLAAGFLLLWGAPRTMGGEPAPVPDSKTGGTAGAGETLGWDAEPSHLRSIWEREVARAPASSFRPCTVAESPVVRVRCARALGHLRRPEALPLLRPLLADPEPEVRFEAAFALGLTPGGAEPIRQALEEAADAAFRVSLLRALGHAGDTDHIPLLLRNLEAGSRPERAAAARALGHLAARGISGTGAPASLAALMGAIDSPWPGIRHNAAFALARTRDLEVDATLARRLDRRTRSTGDATARAWLVRACGRALPSESWRPLAETLLHDSAPGVRVALLRAAGGRDGPEAASTCRDCVRTLLDDPDRSVQVEALRTAIACPPDPSLVAALRAIASDDDVELRARALEALARAGELEHPAVHLAPDVHPLVRAHVLAGLEDEELLLRGALEDSHAPARTAAAHRLLTLEPPISSGLLLQLLGHSDPVVSGMAASAAGSRAADLAPERLVARLESATLPLEGGEHHRVTGLLEGLERLGIPTDPAGASPPLLDPSLRSRLVSSLEALAGSAHHGVREASRKLARESGLSLSAEAPPPPSLPAFEEVARLRSAQVWTTRGPVILTLYPEQAPYTVWRWAQRAESGFYDGQVFHRVVPDFVVQTGDPRGDGWGGAGGWVPDEINPLPFSEGAVGMAHAGPDTADSQWFVTLSPQPHLEGAFTVFGSVRPGCDVIRRIRMGDRIQRIEVERSPAPADPP